MPVTLRTIYSSAEGKKAEYCDENKKIGFLMFPVDTSDKEIIAAFASGKLPVPGKAKADAEKQKTETTKAPLQKKDTKSSGTGPTF